MTRARRQVRRESPPQPRLREAQGRAKGQGRGRRNGAARLHDALCVLPARAARPVLRRRQVAETSAGEPDAVLPGGRLLCVVLRGLAVGHVRRRRGHGARHPRGRHVPAVAAHPAAGRVVPEHGHARAHRALLRDRDPAAHILHRHRARRVARDLGVPQAVRGCRIRASRGSVPPRRSRLTRPVQVESFIPLWEWDLPKKKSKKRKEKAGEAPEKPSKSKASGSNGEASPADVSARPGTHSATIEEVEDDGS